MKAKLLKLWQNLLGSYYFIPSLMVLAAMGLALGTLYLERNAQHAAFDLIKTWINPGQNGARTVLSTIAGSMISVAAVTFSITMVAVTSAAGQYGPRLVGNFMRDRFNQVVLGAFVSTFVYSLLVLFYVGDETSKHLVDFVPSLSLLIAMVLTMVCIGILIRFIHHIPETLNVANIIAAVGGDLSDSIMALSKQARNKNDDDPSADQILENLQDSPATSVCANQRGYVQAVDFQTLIKVADDLNLVMQVRTPPGQFAIQGDVILKIWRGHKEDRKELRLLAAQSARLQSAFAMGPERTAYQNPTFLADELVEILARSLSPGINDPFTAITCIHWYHVALRGLVNAEQPSPFFRGAERKIRLIMQRLSYLDLLNALCTRSRSYVALDPIAYPVLLAMLEDLEQIANSPEHRNATANERKALVLAHKANNSV